MNKAEGIVIAEIHVFEDGDYEYTGRTQVVNMGPTVWDDNTVFLVPELIKCAYDKWPEAEGFEVFGWTDYLYIKP